MNIVQRLYNDPRAEQPPDSFKYPSYPKTKKYPQSATKPKPQSANYHTKQDEYIDQYQKAKHLAKVRNWTDAQLQAMLGDKKAFEREWNSYYRQQKKFI